MNPEYPVYIVSKNRWKNGLTWKALDHMRVPYMVVVEEQEYVDYCKYIDKENIFILPKTYLDNYDTFWYDNDPRKGPGAARNFCWDDSIKKGFKRHWVMDDNLDAFHRLNRNIKAEVESGTIFKVMEDFIDRYKNVYLASPNYYSFVKSTDKITSPFTLNTRIYSCLLIQNDIPYRWRGRYNEDTDLSLRILKDGHCTLQFNSFLQGKVTTQRMRGGNNKEFYGNEGTKKKSQMLAEMHPDVAKVVWKFNRWHHHVDYRPFKKNRLIKKENLDIKKGVNNYGLVLKNISEIK